MTLHRKRITQLSLIFLLFILPLYLQVMPGDRAAAQEPPQEQPLAAALLPLLGPAAETDARPAAVTACTATGCPAAPAGLTDCIEETNFCVYYDSNDNTEGQAQTVADLVTDHWDRYVNDFGFAAPPTPIRVSLLDTTSCNGAASTGANDMSVNSGCFSTPGAMRQVVGHELFHRFQLGYDFDALWFHEGTARASEDMAYTVLDNWTSATTAAFSFNQQVNTYLANTNADLTSNPMRYNSALFWKYFSEQYGSTLTEPEVGIDTFLELWQETASADDISALNNALADLGAGVDFETAFRRFAVANWTKDLTGVPDASYNYADEDQAGNPAPYGPLVPISGGTISTGSPATWSNQGIARYGLRYYEADVGATCPLVSVSFHRDSGPAFYHVITQNGSAFHTHVAGSGDDWTQAFLNNGISKVVAIVGSLQNSAQADLTIECASPSMDIKLPNNGAKAYVQGNTKFLAQVQVTDGSPKGPVVAGLSNSDFTATVNRVDAVVTGGGFVQEQYWLVIRAPSGLANGTYDLEVFLEEPGGSTVIASATEASSVEYTSDLLDHVLVIDRSGSMGTPIEPTNDKLAAAKDAADFYVDITRNNDGLAVVAYHHDVSPTPFDIKSVNATVRSNAKAYIDDWSTPNGIYADGATSIGDGLMEAVKQRAASPTGNTRCSFVLLSDGMENSERKWNSGTNPVKPDVVATGCPVTSIAFGPASNETLMQAIASDTGGASFYNDVYVSTMALALPTPADMTLELAGTYEYSQGRREGRQRILQERGAVSRLRPSATHQVLIDETVAEALFALDWYEQYWSVLDLILTAPDGTVYENASKPYTFPDPYVHTTHVGWRIRDPQPGTWKLEVRFQGSEVQEQIPYQVLVSGRSSLTLHLLLPTRLGIRYSTGLRFPIYAVLSERRAIPGAMLWAMVTAPDGSQTRVQLFDDGQHGDGRPRDGFYAGLYTRVNQALVVQPKLERGVEQPPLAVDEGAYRVRLLAEGKKFRREALGSFAVTEGRDDNRNRIPDVWEEENGVRDPADDPDLDFLVSRDEYLAGTDPNHSDSDGGGENDGSEVEHGQDPLDPSDDQIEAPTFLQVLPLNQGVQVTYDVKKEYARMELWRASRLGGPWTLAVAELPRTGLYRDRVPNGVRYYYRYIAEDAQVTRAGGHRSVVLDSVPVVPSIDPIPPEGVVIINEGALSTANLKVRLTFAPPESGLGESTASFDDIAEMMISNSPFFRGARWQAFNQGVGWTLAAEPGQLARVYVRFRDKNGNESVGTEVGMIWYRSQEDHKLYLPLVLNGF